MDNTDQNNVFRHENTPSTNKPNVGLSKDNVLADQNVTEIIKNNDLNPEEKREQLLNRRAISKIASTYELESFKEKILVIFNQENIDGFKPRIGTEKETLTDTFTKFGFIIREYKDFTKDQIFSKIEEYTHPSNDLSTYGCVAVVVLTYGTDDGQLRAKDMPYSETEIYDRLVLSRNQTLITKPKVIIIQASRGEELVSKNEVQHCLEHIVRDCDELNYRLPRESDSLIIYSHYARSQSNRSSVAEPWFIQVLCEKITLHAIEMDLESIMTEVIKKVNDSKDLNLPVVTSTMLRKLFLRNFGDKPPPMQSFADDKSKNGHLYNLVTLEPTSSFDIMYCDFAKACLKYYMEEMPDDEKAKLLLEEANTSQEFIKISKTILEHLNQNSQDCQCFKQMHVLKN